MSGEIADYYSLWDLTPYAGVLDALDESGVGAGVTVFSVVVSVLVGCDFFLSARGASRSQAFSRAMTASLGFGFFAYITWMSILQLDVAHWAASFSSSMLAWYVPLFVCLTAMAYYFLGAKKRWRIVLPSLVFVALGFLAGVVSARLLVRRSDNLTASWAVIGGVLVCFVAVAGLTRLFNWLGTRKKDDLRFKVEPADYVPRALRDAAVVIVSVMVVMQLAAPIALNAPASFSVRKSTDDPAFPEFERKYNFMLVTREACYYDVAGATAWRYVYSNGRDPSLRYYEQYEKGHGVDSPRADDPGFEAGETRTYIASTEWDSVAKLAYAALMKNGGRGAKWIEDGSTALTCNVVTLGDGSPGWRVARWGDSNGWWRHASSEYYRFAELGSSAKPVETYAYEYDEGTGKTSKATHVMGDNTVEVGVYEPLADGRAYVDYVNADGVGVRTALLAADGTYVSTTLPYGFRG